jgi:transcriptional regulator with XRE-family HTH domain
MRSNVIGPQVRTLRRKAGWPVAKLAARIAAVGGALTASQLEGIEAGSRRVLDDDVLHLARAFGVDVDALFPRRRR